MNECEETNGGCEALCCNTIGSFYCRCPPGLKLNEDRKTCQGKKFFLTRLNLAGLCNRSHDTVLSGNQVPKFLLLFWTVSSSHGHSQSSASIYSSPHYPLPFTLTDSFSSSTTDTNLLFAFPLVLQPASSNLRILLLMCLLFLLGTHSCVCWNLKFFKWNCFHFHIVSNTILVGGWIFWCFSLKWNGGIVSCWFLEVVCKTYSPESDNRALQVNIMATRF